MARIRAHRHTRPPVAPFSLDASASWTTLSVGVPSRTSVHGQVVSFLGNLKKQKFPPAPRSERVAGRV